MKIKSKSLQTWAKLLPFLAPYRKYMVLIVAAMLFSAAIDTVQPLFYFLCRAAGATMLPK